MGWIAPDGVYAPTNDPANLAGMRLWFDERTLAPDGSYATTIEKDFGGAPAYTDLLSVTPATPELDRYFGQTNLHWRPLKAATLGWRHPGFAHDNVAGGRSLIQQDYNGPQVVGTFGNVVPAGVTNMTTLCCLKVPDLTTMVADQFNLILCTTGGTYQLRLLWDSGTTLYAYIVQQGATITSQPFINLTANGIVTGSYIGLRGFFNGAALQLELMKADGTTVFSAAPAVDAMDAAGVNYQIGYGGTVTALAGVEASAAVFATGIHSGAALMPQAQAEAILLALITKYKIATGATWPDSAPEQDPATIQVAHLLSAPGKFTIGGGTVSRAANDGSGGDYVAAGAQEPAYTPIGALPAFTPSATQWLDLETGDEASIIPLQNELTVMGALNCRADATPVQALGNAGTIAGDSSAACGMSYQGGDGLSRGPAIEYAGTGGPHAGGVFTTPVAFYTNPAVQQILVYACLLIQGPSIAGSTAIVRSIASGGMVSDYASAIAVPQTGALRLGNRPTSPAHFNMPETVPYAWDIALTYPEYQRAHRWLAVRAGIA